MPEFDYTRINLFVVSQSKYDSVQELLRRPDFDRGLITVRDGEELPDLTDKLFERIGQEYRASGLADKFLKSLRFRQALHAVFKDSMWLQLRNCQGEASWQERVGKNECFYRKLNQCITFNETGDLKSEITLLHCSRCWLTQSSADSQA